MHSLIHLATYYDGGLIAALNNNQHTKRNVCAESDSKIQITQSFRNREDINISVDEIEIQESYMYDYTWTLF